jgi:hypothetical protein
VAKLRDGPVVANEGTHDPLAVLVVAEVLRGAAARDHAHHVIGWIDMGP